MALFIFARRYHIYSFEALIFQLGVTYRRQIK